MTSYYFCKKFFSGAWRYNHVMQMGNDEDRRRLYKMEESVQPDCPANIQYTSVRGPFSLLQYMI